MQTHVEEKNSGVEEREETDFNWTPLHVESRRGKKNEGQNAARAEGSGPSVGVFIEG